MPEKSRILNFRERTVRVLLAAGELLKIQLADNNGAGSSKPPDDCRVLLVKRGVGEHARRCRGARAPDTHVVLDGNRNALQRAKINAFDDLLFRDPGRG